MALARLQQDDVYRFYLASKHAFADWTNPTKAEMNANPTNDPAGNIWNLTCAIDTDSTTHDLGSSERDESLSFCQVAGDSTRMAENPEVVWQFFRAADRWDDATSLLAADGFNTANLAQSLLTWRGPEYLFIMSVGRSPNAAFDTGDRLKMVGGVLDWGVNVIGTGENVRMSQTPALTGDVNWNYKLA